MIYSMYIKYNQRKFVSNRSDPRFGLCVVYLDNTIIAGPDVSTIEEFISSLGIAKVEQWHYFELRDEGEVGDFLGIRIDKEGSKKCTLTQTGLITKVLKDADMDDYNLAKAPCSTVPFIKMKMEIRSMNNGNIP